MPHRFSFEVKEAYFLFQPLVQYMAEWELKAFGPFSPLLLKPLQYGSNVFVSRRNHLAIRMKTKAGQVGSNV